MKRIIIWAVMSLCLPVVVMAQGQKLRGRVIDKDYYPVKGAMVTVKGTGQSAKTDDDGNYQLDDVPLYLDSVQIEKGKKRMDIATPMQIEMGRLVMDRFSWFVKAGVGASRFLSCDDTKDKLSFHAGVGIDLKLSKHWAFQPAAYIAYREMKANTWHYDADYTNYKLTYLEIPLLFAYKFRLSSSLNWVISAGPYMDCGINGDGSYEIRALNPVSDKYETQIKKFDIFGKRFTGGLAYGMGIESRRLIFGLTGRTGWTSWNYSEGFTNLEFEVGYKF